MRIPNPMNFQQTALEGAFDIARLHCKSVEDIKDIRRRLIREGFDQRQIEGPILGRQLLEISRRSCVQSHEDV